MCLVLGDGGKAEVVQMRESHLVHNGYAYHEAYVPKRLIWVPRQLDLWVLLTEDGEIRQGRMACVALINLFWPIKTHVI